MEAETTQLGKVSSSINGHEIEAKAELWLRSKQDPEGGGKQLFMKRKQISEGKLG